MQVHQLTVGPLAENCFLVRATDGSEALLFDPGDEAPRILETLEQTGATLAAILLTHTHFDHIGAVAPVAAATGAPVWCPELEAPVLADIDRYVPWPEFGPFESYRADHLLRGGERLELAGLELDVLSTPGHSPGHVSYSIGAAGSLFSGDVLFQGSIGRTDLPGGDTATLMASIAMLLDALGDETRVFPGHMGQTTLGAERARNPFLRELATPRGR
jgi:glyoxylase-like metal-dependent hydrolase (beta-lactamase superfamily II)